MLPKDLDALFRAHLKAINLHDDNEIIQLIRNTAEALEAHLIIRFGRTAKARNARKLPAGTVSLDWRATGPVTIPYNEAEKLLGLRHSTFINYLGRNKGQFTLKRDNPATGAEDVVTVTRLAPMPRQ